MNHTRTQRDTDVSSRRHRNNRLWFHPTPVKSNRSNNEHTPPGNKRSFTVAVVFAVLRPVWIHSPPPLGSVTSVLPLTDKRNENTEGANAR